MKIFLQTLILTFTIITLTFAQPSASFNFFTSIPIGEFNDYTDGVGFGGNLEFFFFTPSERTPYGLGFNFSYLSFGAHFYNNPYSDELELSFDKANNFASAHLLFQISSYKGTIRPYLETLFGGSYIYSLTEIGYDRDGPVHLWIDDWAWSYGVGAGLKFFLTGDPFFNSGATYLDFKVRYLMSTSTGYLDRNSVEIYYDEVYYSTIESNTDMLNFSLGFYFFF